MQTQEFITNYREAFGADAQLPLLFWYSDTPFPERSIVKGCMFKAFGKIRKGIAVSLSRETITCGGGKLYTGFDEMFPMIPQFVSIKERYKQTPEAVLNFINSLQIVRAEKEYLNFARIDQVEDISQAEGIIFIATPDMLAGLTTWAWFDNDAADAVTTLFGSGCSAAITLAVNENRNNGQRVFLGGFDPSVRPYLKAGELMLTVPGSRFQEMLTTMRKSCLYDTHAWQKVTKRIQRDPH